MNIQDTQPRRHRFWIEAAASTFFAIVTILTLAVPEWIEAVSGIKPDSGNGSAEWALVVLAGGTTAMLTWIATREWRRGRVAASPA